MCSLCSFELRVNKIFILLRGDASVFILIINECYPRINAVALRLFFFYGLYCKKTSENLKENVLYTQKLKYYNTNYYLISLVFKF